MITDFLHQYFVAIQLVVHHPLFASSTPLRRNSETSLQSLPLKEGSLRSLYRGSLIGLQAI